MNKAGYKTFSAALGAGGGILSISGCAGACPACWRCVGAGLGLILLLLIRQRPHRPEKTKNRSEQVSS